MNRRPEPELMDLAEEAQAYAAADFSAVNQAFVDRLIELYGATRAVAIDLGTGPADIPLRVVKQRPEWRITAVDAAPAMVKIARAGVKGQIELLLADAKSTGLLDASFDLVFSNSILHHVSDPVALWREAKRLLKPVGFVFFRDLTRPPNESAARNIVATHAGAESKLLQEEFFRSLLAAYTVDEVRGQLRRAGLAGLQIAMSSDRHVDVWGEIQPTK